MEKVKRKISEKKIMLFILIASIAAVAIYLIFLIPHSTTTEFFQSDIRDEAITTYPLSREEYIIESAKLFLIINIPNVLILIKHFSRFLAEKLSWMGKRCRCTRERYSELKKCAKLGKFLTSHH